MKFCNIKSTLIIVSSILSAVNAGNGFFPKKTVKYYDKPSISASVGKGVAISDATSLNITQISLDALKKEYPDMEFIVGNAIKDDGTNTAYVHVSQAVNGYEIINSAANINIDIPTRTVISSGIAVWENVKIFDPTEHGLENLNLDVEDALDKVAEYFNYDYDKDETEFTEKNGVYTIDGVKFTYNHKAVGEKKYITISEEYVDCVWELSLEVGQFWYLARISCTTGSLLNIENLASHAVAVEIPHAIYHALPWNSIDITEGRILYVDPYDKTASPLGWHNIDERTVSADTSGNNVIVQDNHDASDIDTNDNTQKVLETNEDGLVFDFSLNLDSKTVEENFPASATNVFVLINKLHDVYYKFGFNEQFGNFQVSNFGKGGKGNDPVKVLIQDRSGSNNANFATPVDGYSPKMRLYPFTAKSSNEPEKDSALVNQIMIHEYSHGVTQRLTGGPDKTSCLSSDESNALSEGWSDFFAIAMELNSTNTRTDSFKMFEWLYGDIARSKPISTDMEINDLTYNSLSYDAKGRLECHMGGEVWVNALNEVLWNFIDIYGISNDVSESEITSKSEGNVLAIQIVVDALKTQPCNPTFIEARDAIILAQKQRFNKNDLHCAIWKGFAKRGMGVNAKPATENNGRVEFVNDFEVPSECQ